MVRSRVRPRVRGGLREREERMSGKSRRRDTVTQSIKLIAEWTEKAEDNRTNEKKDTGNTLGHTDGLIKNQVRTLSQSAASCC